MMDIQKFESIVRAYSKQLYRYCYLRLNGDPYLCDETINDIMLVLYKKWDKLTIDDGIRAYLYRVADLCIKQSLKKYNRFYSRNESYEEYIIKNNVSEHEHYDEYFVRDDIDEEECIKNIMQDLPSDYRDLFAYLYIDKLSILEVSRIMGRPYSSLRYHVLKLEKQVKKKIQNYFLEITENIR